MNRTLTSLFAAATLAVSSLAFSTSASAMTITITMDGEDPFATCPTAAGDPLSIGDGFEVTGLAGTGGICDGGGVGPLGLASGDHVLNVDTGASFTLRRSTPGALFSLVGFDVFSILPSISVGGGAPIAVPPVTFTTIDGTTLTDVADVSEVVFTVSATAIFNNFVVEVPTGSNVSEPGSIAMMGLGLGLLGLRLRRRKSVNA